MHRKTIFDTVRHMLGRGFRPDEVRALDGAIDAASKIAADAPDLFPLDSVTPVPGSPPTRAVSARGAALIRRFEGCAKVRADGMVEAYPDPASEDGRPWTIGWGSTGPGIEPGTCWTRAQCDARFDADLAHYAAAVARAIGDAPTTANQFDALVSFHYNTGAIARATLTRLHRAGDFAAAEREFGRWIFAGGRPLAGLRNRRAEEARLYAGK
jgi:lysozyme